MKKTKTIWLLSDKISWKLFQKLQKDLVVDSGPTPVGGDKILWQLLRDKKIYCWFDSETKEDMLLGTSIPKRYNNYQKYIINDFGNTSTKKEKRKV